jgi:segregation and condensation protein A
MECVVKLDAFEGPLDLLLHLIRKNEIDIHDIPMSLITAQYLDYLNMMRSMNLDIASDYLVMAATLVHIKSQMILPAPSTPGDGEESEEIEDPRAELVRRLLEYERYKEAAQRLAERELLERDVFSRPPGGAEVPEGQGESAGLEEVSIALLLDAFQRLMASRNLDAVSLQVDLERVSLADRIQEIFEILERRPSGITFEELFPEGASRGEMVITFLAILEMVRLRMIRAHQAGACGAILLVRAVQDPSEAKDEEETA